MGSINKVEELEQEIADAGIDLIDYPFKSKRLRGITFVSQNEKIIGISKQVTDLSERLTILSEELSHIELNVGDVTSDISQEKRARFRGYDRLVGFKGLVSAYKNGCQDLYEFADHLNVTYDYLIECLKAYQSRYELPQEYENFIISFRPTLTIERIENYN